MDGSSSKRPKKTHSSRVAKLFFVLFWMSIIRGKFGNLPILRVAGSMLGVKNPAGLGKFMQKEFSSCRSSTALAQACQWKNFSSYSNFTSSNNLFKIRVNFQTRNLINQKAALPQ